MTPVFRLTATTAALVAANYIFQGFTEHNWAVAFDRSFFQAVAVAIVGWNMLRGIYVDLKD